MADVAGDKKLKLANTKKRFKELQELKKKRNGNNDGSKTPDPVVQDPVNSHSAQSSSRNTPVLEKSTQEQEVLSYNNLTSPDFTHIVAQEQAFSEVSQHVPVSYPPLNDLETTPEQESALPYYVDPSKIYPTPAAFFDNISPTNNPQKDAENEVQNVGDPSLLTYFNTSEGSPNKGSAGNIGMARYFDNIHSSDRVWENTVLENTNKETDDYRLFPRGQIETNGEPSTASPIEAVSAPEEDVLSEDYPEIKQNDISAYIRRKSAENLSLGQFSQAQYNEKSLENIYSPSDQNLMEYFGKAKDTLWPRNIEPITQDLTSTTTDNNSIQIQLVKHNAHPACSTGATEDEKTDICHTNQEIDSSSNLTKHEIQDSSNVESLRQLSNQLDQIVEPSYEYSSSGSITDLEKRNIELAAHLDRERIRCEQLQAINSEFKSRISQLESQLTRQELGSTLQNAQETVHMKNELQTHLQTIGLLVAEKTELSSNLNQYESNFKWKKAECEELQARLKTSRSRVADLERELNSLKSEKSQSESMGEQYSATLNNLKQEYKYLRDQKEELAQDVLEVREKLKTTLEENVKLQQDNKNVAGKLSLAEVKIQQLSSGGAIGIDSQVEQLTHEKFSLESDITNLNQMLKSIITERDESTVQYQQYAQQLNAQISNLSSKLEQLQHEKENLIVQEQNRIKHIGELERQLQNVQNDQVTYATRNSSNTDLKSELDKSRELCVQLQIEKSNTDENYTKVANEKELLLKELEAKTDSISQLESMVEQLKGNQPDSVKLLATMESDKVAASRAIQQNKELKQQLESMQEVFMKMDNDKVVLTENFKAQQQTNKELIEKLQKTELTLQSLADAIEIKDKELTHLRDASEDMNRQAIQHEQLEDRLRHYEAHGNSAHVLQHELQEAKQTISRLTNELNKKHDEGVGVEDGNELLEARQTILELTKLNVSPQEDASKVGVKEIQEKEKYSVEVAQEIREEVELEDVVSTKQNGIDGNENILDKERAMEYLEVKVKRTMQEIADLTDEKQRLEHIVLQLQGETETIGEYVALYQRQRMILKQKALEKDQQLKQLANDREQIKVKLDRLNELIRKLVTEKGTVPAELLEHQETMNHQLNNFCEEHSKMNEEINKIKQSNVIEPDTEVNSEVQDTTSVPSRTAEEIISLLSEIKTSNLVQPDENFHHCPWCSGQLMTV